MLLEALEPCGLVIEDFEDHAIGLINGSALPHLLSHLLWARHQHVRGIFVSYFCLGGRSVQMPRDAKVAAVVCDA